MKLLCHIAVAPSRYVWVAFVVVFTNPVITGVTPALELLTAPPALQALGGGGIRTPGGCPSPNFKISAFNRSAALPATAFKNSAINYELSS
ncbi:MULTISPECIES: hypothetical protein [Azotobacter]|uniref:hypothetical protein n=1 Tax=Azotobacter TaxID=352 RepID=UPI0011DCF7B8|nr:MULTISPECIES: hypothetical protein [Azotobacter]